MSWSAGWVVTAGKSHLLLASSYDCVRSGAWRTARTSCTSAATSGPSLACTVLMWSADTSTASATMPAAMEAPSSGSPAAHNVSDQQLQRWVQQGAGQGRPWQGLSYAHLQHTAQPGPLPVPGSAARQAGRGPLRLASPQERTLRSCSRQKRRCCCLCWAAALCAIDCAQQA